MMFSRSLRARLGGQSALEHFGMDRGHSLVHAPDGNGNLNPHRGGGEANLIVAGLYPQGERHREFSFLGVLV